MNYACLTSLALSLAATAAMAGPMTRTGACTVTSVFASATGFAAALDCTFPAPANSYVKAVYHPGWTNPGERALHATLLTAQATGAKVNVTFDADNQEGGVSLRTLASLQIVNHSDHNSTWAYRMYDLQLAQ